MTRLNWATHVHAFSTLALVGLIWFVQLVHYPLFGGVGVAEFAKYESAHTRRTTWIVAPLMLAELLSAAALLLLPEAASLRPYAWVGALLVGVNWASTFFVQVPCHERLTHGFDPATALWLVRSNWVRTLAWTARGVLALLMLQAALRGDRGSG